MRVKFEEQLTLLHRELIAMGALLEKAISLALTALTGDIRLAEELPACCAEIDRKEREIEGLCMRLLLQQQPVAGDLRTISSALKMVTDMERIGDNAGDIAEIVRLGHVGREADTLKIGEMANATAKMVTDSIDAFVKRDRALARSVVDYDDVVDGHFNRIKRALVGRLRESSGGQDGFAGEFALDLLMIAKYFERMGDHAAEIAHWVLYSLTGSREG